ncbi:hypothetical protein M2139_001855 [Enterococcus sp. PF1-24]|uniref:hypothetical protein n=1 Tax=unclassified Enterococcus TaxID=2608891 RepID=UPI00247585E1|nr:MULTISPECIES: hypothetical protein [unclassified Enterococcus]MDH6364821.1 hypothetical protein [Enterococcus sp. PFB1-1]MDH6401955.1 hypothetical protein [Enterococcus sp. PF1-24]
MINQSATLVEALAEDLGVKIRIPRPTKRDLQISAATNCLVGAGLTAGGIIISSKTLVFLGVVGLASSVAMQAYLDGDDWH